MTTDSTISIVYGLREMIDSGRLTKDMIPDDFRWLEAMLAELERLPMRSPTVVDEGTLKKNLNASPDTPRPPAPRSQVAPSHDRLIADLLGEALRRHQHGLIRPLWRDMPEGPEKQGWRDAGRALLDFDDVRESIRSGARRATKTFNL